MHAPATDSAACTVSALGERALVDRITRRLPKPDWVVVGAGDDAAVVETVPRALEVLTTDAMLDGVHFDLRFVPPDAVGHRVLAANLSDLAAMGARPRAALLSLALPATLEVAVVDGLLDGLLAAADTHRIVVVGGNITRTPGPLTVDVTVTGSVHKRRVLTRRGARVGDHVYVTGTVGDARVGLAALHAHHGLTPATDGRPSGTFPRCTAQYLRPEPRLLAGRLLAQQKLASACIDLSDGLADGVYRLAEGAGVGITLDALALPLSDELRLWYGDAERAYDAALQGGDDYELLFTCSPRAKRRLAAVQRLVGDLPITRIGVVTKARDVRVRTPSGDRELPHGFAHFG